MQRTIPFSPLAPRFGNENSRRFCLPCLICPSHAPVAASDVLRIHSETLMSPAFGRPVDQASRRPSTTLATSACRRRRQGGTATEIVKARHANLPIFVSVLATQSERPPTSDSVLLIPPCRLHRQELDRRRFSQDRKSKQLVLPIRGNLVAKGRNRQSVSPPAIHGASGPTPQHLVYVSQSK